ncbi:MAG: hypothetical protein RMN25_00705 [Anaerolineae bacterium]|nr:hypothetical protein [Thermoflexales bacterium]MDW8406275.1 hypothetical protein [Anaerolineae bacterium]
MADIKPTITVKFFVDGNEVGTILLTPKDFKTGSTGFYGMGKIAIGDDAEKGYQAQVQLVRIGSKEARNKVG